jgi:hypothetical protein
VTTERKQGSTRALRSGRPPKLPEDRRVQFSVRVGPDYMPVLDALASALQLTRSSTIEAALTALLAQHPRVKEEIVARVSSRGGLMSLDKEQVTQLQALAAGAKTQELSAPMAETLRDLVQQLSQGEPVTLFPDDTVLTLAQASNLFAIALPNLEQRLDKGKVPFFVRGSERYVYIRDMIAYDRAKRAEQHRLMGTILDTSQELGAYDLPPSVAPQR